MAIVRLTDDFVKGLKQDRQDLLEAQRLVSENIEDLALQINIVNRITSGIAAISAILGQCGNEVEQKGQG